MTTPFDFVNDLSYNKKNIFNEETSTAYLPFIINRAFSNFIDTVLIANEMNMHSELDKDLQNVFLINIIRPAKRFAKWYKKTNNEDLQVVMEYYGYNTQKGEAALKLLSKKDIDLLKKEFEQGG